MKKDGVEIDLTKLNLSVNADADWSEGDSKQIKDGKEELKNNVDLLFSFLKDAQDNTSYNLVWAMNEKNCWNIEG